MNRAKGHVRDVDRPSGIVHPDHLVGGIFVPESIELPARIYDQGGQNCTMAYATILETWCAARGIECAPVSHRFNYTVGRQLANPDAPLADVGARPSAVVDGVRNVGIASLAACPGDSPDVINEPVDFFTIERAIEYRAKDVSVIEEDGAERCAAIRRALAASYPVAFGLYVGDAFEGWTGDGTYDSLDGHAGHALRCVGYAPSKFLIAGSWGPGHGFGGYCWISDRVMGSAIAFDHYFMSFAKAVRE